VVEEELEQLVTQRVQGGHRVVLVHLEFIRSKSNCDLARHDDISAPNRLSVHPGFRTSLVQGGGGVAEHPCLHEGSTLLAVQGGVFLKLEALAVVALETVRVEGGILLRRDHLSTG